MEQLDDLDYNGLRDPEGRDIDLWDHKMAATIKSLEEIFAEVVDEDTILAPSATILDSTGKPVKPTGKRTSYADGLPALLKFQIPANCDSFSLILPGNPPIQQKLT